jgi:hypothetical protein
MFWRTGGCREACGDGIQTLQYQAGACRQSASVRHQIRWWEVQVTVQVSRTYRGAQEPVLLLALDTMTRETAPRLPVLRPRLPH